MISGSIDIRKSINELGKKGVPFLFALNYDLSKAIIQPPHEISGNNILFDINGFKNYTPVLGFSTPVNLIKNPISYDAYYKIFKKVLGYLQAGNSYLLNLTFQSPIEVNLSLFEIFMRSRARYKLLTPDFVVFSPEIFLQTREDRIYSYPMKGTIDSSVPDAENAIMDDYKELSEHTTIVDLIRNDLSFIADRVRVDKFRYIDKLETHDKTILQVSSKISGDLRTEYKNNIGDLLYSLLPAGSITGAPKKKTIEIINVLENYTRGFFSGILGYYDGKDLDCGVSIRFIEKNEGKFYFKSGGGITVNSDPASEYQEMISKIYVPIY